MFKLPRKYFLQAFDTGKLLDQDVVIPASAIFSGRKFNRLLNFQFAKKVSLYNEYFNSAKIESQLFLEVLIENALWYGIKNKILREKTYKAFLPSEENY